MWADSPVGFAWPNSTRAVVFGQGRALTGKIFATCRSCPAAAVRKFKSKVKPVMQLLFALEGSM